MGRSGSTSASSPRAEQDGLELRLLGSLALAVAPSAAGKQQVHVSFALRADGTLALAAAEVQPNVARATFSTSGVALPGGRLLGEATITDAAAPFWSSLGVTFGKRDDSLATRTVLA